MVMRGPQAVVRVGADGAELGRTVLTIQPGAETAQATLVDTKDAVGLIVVALHAGYASRAFPMDPNDLGLPSSYRLTVYPG